MNRSIRSAILATAIAALFVIVSCATNPVTGKREFVLMTESQEIALGREADREIVATYGLYPDQDLQNYVSVIGQRMASLSHRPHLEWHFRVLDTPVVNAFALPGGYIYITRGTLAHMNSEAELAMVIGHEIGHVTARHGVRQYTRQMLILGGLAVGAAVNKTFRKFAPLAMVGAQLLFLKYSRDQERQADDLGVLYGYRMGYDPERFDDFFITLNRMKETRGSGGLPGWLSTHPVTELRINDVQEEGNRIMAETPPSGQLLVRQNEFLQRIDGLVYGDNPRLGYTEGNAFHHPDLRFSFNYPTNWNLINTNAMVQMQPGSEDAFIQLTLKQTSDNPQTVFNEFLSANNLTFVNGGYTSINQHSAYQGVCELDEEDVTQLRLLVTCISKDNNVYTFFGASEPANFNSYYNAFASTPGSFRSLTDSRALGRQPMRLHVRSVGSRQPARRFLLRSGVVEKMVDEVLLINARMANDLLPSNSLMKLVR